MSLFMSLIGMAVLLGIAVLLSSNRKAINLRTVGGAFAIQFSLGAFILYVPWGQELLRGFSDAVSNVINYGNDGTGFLFGNLVNFSVDGLGFIFAFKVLPTLIFFSALISVLYYLGVMQWVIRILGGGLQKALGTSRAESMSAAANIFVGQTEAPLVVRPFVPKMTQSELFAVMCGGLASIAGGVLAGYASMGVKIEYLVAASFMAAPGGLLFAKLMMPETEKAQDHEDIALDGGDDKPANVIDAAAGGASAGLQLALNVGAMLIAFIGLIALINGMLGGIGGWFGMPELKLEMLLGWLFAPLAFLIGVPWNEATVAGEFIGLKTVANEFVAYSQFAPYLTEAAPVVLSEKTKAIISFALCGFANLSSIAILLGGLGSLAPKRRGDIARMGVKAVIAGTLSNLMAATIAGFFLSF
ncbi:MULTISPECIES: NupC/NupG family nucleoside CNT transporter [Vibrio]|uniref:Nucleoside permease n=1 Tax=Vibrio paracholerae TaxID=650003 RepID=A0ABD7FU57_9VIBR|nr:MULTISPECIES: NupC/NupG family nucleoside CNT transporter [Vibrio]EGR1858921.1 NupC/NupG family nucleoside CNT transporter [Vibrio cholerae]EGR5061566.1 NupC/NupG family nucleoside CNT transporter [Vibrio cholerae]EJL6524104.1 NupC/NupG family nucleoside CNT transporter [Vibrio cholerae]EJL6760097.1 NupC/NupG family nucleoside CNT transporter [Vibrio cholerae]EMC4023859.1 NupC/NupG family nucleoside CNT transporter [Vibrio cholerae]